MSEESLQFVGSAALLFYGYDVLKNNVILQNDGTNGNALCVSEKIICRIFQP